MGVALFFVAIVVMIGLVLAEVKVTNSNGFVKQNFSTSDAIYVKSDKDLCNGAYEAVDLYVVESGAEGLGDVRDEESQEVELTSDFAIDLVEVWSNPDAGEYEVLIDCDKDGNYHLLEPKAVFRVVAEKGSASASLGENDPGNHSWKYDPEDLNLINEMLQISLLAEKEDLELRNITIELKGEEGIDISKLEVYVDEDGNGKAGDEELIGDFKVESPLLDEAKVTISLDYKIEEGEEKSILIVAGMKEDIEGGSFSLTVESLDGKGEESDSLVKFDGFPISSGVKTILPKKTCVGFVSLELNPKTANKDSKVIAKIGNLEGCRNKRVSLRLDGCDGEEVDFCVSEGGGCDLIFTASETQDYYACIDKNSDGDMDDGGESISEELVVSEEEEEGEEEGEEGTSISEFIEEKELDEEKEGTGVTGASVLGGLSGNLLGAAGGFLILLEVTLLLILFVLIMILFKLKSPVSIEEEESEEE